MVYTYPNGQFAFLFGMAAGQFAGMAAGMVVGGITAYNVAKNNGATHNQAILAGFGGAVVGGAIGYGLGSIDYGGLFSGGAGPAATSFSSSVAGSLSGVNNSLFQGVLGGSGLSLVNYLDPSSLVNRAPDHLSASIGDPPQTWRDPKTGKPLASGAVEPNTWIEEWVIGGKVVGGTLKLGSMAWGATRGATVATETSISGGEFLFNSWHKGTFISRTQSVMYHLGKHGKGRTAVQYTQDAMNFFNKNKSLGQKMILKDGTQGIKIQTKQIINGKTQRVGGIWTNTGKLVTFWD